MRGKDIKEGETYLFVATTSAARKHLEGTEFTVQEKRLVFRRLQKGRKKVYRFFNEDGIGARPEELEPLQEAVQCHICRCDLEEDQRCALCGQPFCAVHKLPGTERLCVQCDDLPF